MRAAVLVLAMVATVHAQPAPSSPAGASNQQQVSAALQDIARLEQQLEYEQALVLADRTIARGIATRDQLADLHLIAGRLAAGLDHPDIAQQHFAKLLALRPDTALVAGTSPKLQAPFDAARAAPHELAIVVNADRLVVERDSLHLVQGTRSSGTTLEAFDEFGNQLAVGEIRRAVDIPVRRASRAWIPWAAASGATLVAGGLCAWRYGVAQDEWNRENDGMHDYTRLHALETRGQHWAIAADVGFGLAAATAITAAILFATGDRGEATGVAFTGTGVTYAARF
ncbi:MAG TPA: hypothetical protein VFQ65_34425 [Kofleriaceae bacterium]|nr:hypothetical protein [Kofleriaceae bacterium]